MNQKVEYVRINQLSCGDKKVPQILSKVS